MLRLLSLIFLLAGAGIAALGAWLYMGNELPANLLGQNQIALERKVLDPVEAPQPAAIVEEAPAATAPPPPPPPPPAPAAAEDIPTATLPASEPMPEMAPMEAEVIEPEAPAAPRSRSLSVTAPPPAAVEDAIVEVIEEIAPAPGAVALDVPPVEEPVFSTTATPPAAAVLPPPPPPTIEEQLYSVPIAYETPASAAFNQSFTVTLAINAQDGAETATGGLSGSGSTNIEEAIVQVTDQVKADLFGDAFEITAKSPEIQKLSKSTESRWRWEVTPTKSGPQELTFEIFAVHPDQASELVRTFDDTVTVEVSRIGQAMFLAQQYNPIVVILAGIGSLLAGLFGVLRFFRGG